MYREIEHVLGSLWASRLRGTMRASSAQGTGSTKDLTRQPGSNTPVSFCPYTRIGDRRNGTKGTRPSPLPHCSKAVHTAL